MPLDLQTILATAVLSELGKGLVKGLHAVGRKWLSDLFADEPGLIRAKAEENVNAFLVDLALRVGQLERSAGSSEELQQRLATSQVDPDVFATTRTALLAAARTSDSAKRSILADVVARRINALAESDEALAANFATEIIPRLTPADLDTVGLIGLVNGVRPRILPADTPPPDEPNDAPLVGYGRWLFEALCELRLGLWSTDDRFLHLAATGVCTIHLGLTRQVHDVLLEGVPPADGLSQGQQFVEVNRLLHFFDSGKDLQKVWRDRMQEVLLTPAGVLIAMTVVEARLPSAGPLAWRANSSAIRDALRKAAAWDGRTISREFAEAIDEALAHRLANAKLARGIVSRDG